MRRTLLLTVPFIALAACSEESEPTAAPVAPVTTPELVVGVATIEPLARTLDLTAEAAGVVARIAAQANDTVVKGDTLIALRNASEAARAEQRRAALATHQSVMDAAAADVTSARVENEQAQREWKRTATLHASGAATLQALEQEQTEAEKWDASLRQTQAREREAKAKMRELEADLRAALADLGRTVVLAPTDGLVLSVDVRPGSPAAVNSKLGSFAPTGPLMAVTEVDELYADAVQLGNKAYIRPQGRTDTLSMGTVVFAAPALSAKSLFSGQATDLEDRRVREVHVQLDRPDVLIGSRVECVIILPNKAR